MLKISKIFRFNKMKKHNKNSNKKKMSLSLSLKLQKKCYNLPASNNFKLLYYQNSNSQFIIQMIKFSHRQLQFNLVKLYQIHRIINKIKRKYHKIRMKMKDRLLQTISKIVPRINPNQIFKIHLHKNNNINKIPKKNINRKEIKAKTTLS